MGDANHLSSQAINNIRTVRAFSTEKLEKEKYDTVMNDVLKKGIKDAIAGAGTFALTNYMDLAIGVLILWYGGSVAMDSPNILSVGNLITFQLYWYFMTTAEFSYSEGI
jgi:ABC-type multidrug transport system fused ATPase/permease subunit